MGTYRYRLGDAETPDESSDEEPLPRKKITPKKSPAPKESPKKNLGIYIAPSNHCKALV